MSSILDHIGPLFDPTSIGFQRTVGWSVVGNPPRLAQEARSATDAELGKVVDLITRNIDRAAGRIGRLLDNELDEADQGSIKPSALLRRARSFAAVALSARDAGADLVSPETSASLTEAVSDWLPETEALATDWRRPPPPTLTRI